MDPRTRTKGGAQWTDAAAWTMGRQTGCYSLLAVTARGLGGRGIDGKVYGGVDEA
jgi:hypothetical protein